MDGIVELEYNDALVTLIIIVILDDDDDDDDDDDNFLRFLCNSDWLIWMIWEAFCDSILLNDPIDIMGFILSTLSSMFLLLILKLVDCVKAILPKKW